LKKEGYTEATIEGYGNKLKVLSGNADLNYPESVKEAIADKPRSVAYKEALVNAYNHYVRVNGLVWNRPSYKRQARARLTNSRHYSTRTSPLLY
jgi:hypothetical protein